MTATLGTPTPGAAVGVAPGAGATAKGKNHYGKGTRFEHKTRDDLTANGYDVMRAAGSKGSTKVDLIAVKPGQLLFIQCKATGTLPPAEWDRIVEVAAWVGAVPLLAANGPNGRGVLYTRLNGPKRRNCRIQPCEPFLLDELAEAVTS